MSSLSLELYPRYLQVLIWRRVILFNRSFVLKNILRNFRRYLLKTTKELTAHGECRATCGMVVQKVKTAISLTIWAVS
jgi:hypothetical protein